MLTYLHTPSTTPQLIRFSGVAAGEACTVVLRGATTQMVEEAERSLHDALSVLSQTVRETRVTLGGGCAEMAMSKEVDEEARKTAGKKALATEAFARALRQLPTILADNAGLDSSELVSQLRAAHQSGDKHAGLDLDNGKVASMIERGVTESYKLKKQVVVSASEAAEMILRVDDILKARQESARRIRRKSEGTLDHLCIIFARLHGAHLEETTARNPTVRIPTRDRPSNRACSHFNTHTQTQTTAKRAGHGIEKLRQCEDRGGRESEIPLGQDGERRRRQRGACAACACSPSRLH